MCIGQLGLLPLYTGYISYHHLIAVWEPFPHQYLQRVWSWSLSDLCNLYNLVEVNFACYHFTLFIYDNYTKTLLKPVSQKSSIMTSLWPLWSSQLGHGQLALLPLYTVYIFHCFITVQSHFSHQHLRWVWSWPVHNYVKVNLACYHSTPIIFTIIS